VSGQTAHLTAEPVASEPRAEALVSVRAFVAAAIVAIIGAEALIAFVDPLIGVALDAAIVAALAGHRYVFAPRGTRAPSSAIALACLALSLLPILRLLSLTLPARRLLEITWYELVGAPILAVLVMLCRLDADLLRLVRVPRDIPVQVAIALTGVPLGLLGYLITQERPLESGSDARDFVLAPLILIVFSGVMEELLFRGALTVTLERIWGRWVGLAGATLLFAAFHLDTEHLAYVPFAAAYGLAFGLAVRRTGSLAGVAMAHGLLTVGLIIVWPHLLY
jgi:membrane protease YdiL (CAAX protease family)